MRVGLLDIDPQIAAQALDRLSAPSGQFLKDNIHWSALNLLSWEFQRGMLKLKPKRAPNVDEKRAYELRRSRESETALRGILAALLPLGGAAGIGAATYALHAPIPVQAAAVASSWIAATSCGVLWTLSATPKRRLALHIRLEEMRAVFPLLTLTRAERSYCDTLLLLGRVEVNPDTERSLRDTLAQLNALVAADRQLEQRRQALLPLLGTNAIDELEREHVELGRRLDGVTDEITRQSLQQSLQMCRSRLENAQALQQGLERIKAQQEAILHTIASAQTAMARLQIAPQPQTEIVAQEIADSVTQMNRQTVAVERAVEEVLTLRIE